MSFGRLLQFLHDTLQLLQLLHDFLFLLAVPLELILEVLFQTLRQATRLQEVQHLLGVLFAEVVRVFGISDFQENREVLQERLFEAQVGELRLLHQDLLQAQDYFVDDLFIHRLRGASLLLVLQQDFGGEFLVAKYQGLTQELLQVFEVAEVVFSEVDHQTEVVKALDE